MTRENQTDDPLLTARIMVVDEELANQRKTLQILSRAGAKVVTVGDGEMARDLAMAAEQGFRQARSQQGGTPSSLEVAQESGPFLVPSAVGQHDTEPQKRCDAVPDPRAQPKLSGPRGSHRAEPHVPGHLQRRSSRYVAP